ncbi:MAG TPA: iron-sulfur cluster biosynthesis family protein [archaeon]|nr:iron-sulfur cluster biosynthesis family protein [archaeon]
MPQVTRRFMLSQVFAACSEAQRIMKKNGIKAVGSPLETLEDVGKRNGLDSRKIDSIVDEINNIIDKGTDYSKIIINITDSGAEVLKNELNRRKKKYVSLRLASDTGIYTYDMDFSNTRSDKEIEIKSNGILLALDKKTSMLLSGTTIDFDPVQGGFVFHNPNFKK